MTLTEYLVEDCKSKANTKSFMLKEKIKWKKKTNKIEFKPLKIIGKFCFCYALVAAVASHCIVCVN